MVGGIFRRRGVARAIVLVAALFLVAGCGGETSEERAQQDWEARSGADWATFEDGWKGGWLTGCEQAADAIVARHRDDPGIDFYDPGCGDRPAYDEVITETPSSPPLHPHKEGYEVGLVDGCIAANFAYGEDRDGVDCYADPSSWKESGD